MRAYAFEWDAPSGPPQAAAAVVIAGNIADARLIFDNYLKRKGSSLANLLGRNFNSTTPGPHWTERAKKALKKRVVYYHGGT